MASRKRRLKRTRKQLERLRSFVSSTREEFGELGLQQTSFGADLINPEILERFQRGNFGGRRGRKRLSQLLRTPEGQRFAGQLATGGTNIRENEEDILARLEGRRVRRTAARRIQAGRAITRRTGGLGLLGRTGNNRPSAQGV